MMTWQQWKAKVQNEVDEAYWATVEATEREDGHYCCCCTGECSGAFDIDWKYERKRWYEQSRGRP